MFGDAFEKITSDRYQINLVISLFSNQRRRVTLIAHLSKTVVNQIQSFFEPL